MADKIDSMKRKYPDEKRTALVSKIGKLWKVLDVDKKEKY